jgi:serine/threonine-protein kinase
MMPLDPPDEQERAVVLRAMAIAPDERAAYLQEACRNDPGLLRRVQARLAAQVVQPPPDSGQAAAPSRGTIVIGESLLVATRSESGSAEAVPDSVHSHHGRFLPGTKIAGRYRIVSLAGKGGMGEVYRADDMKLGNPVALKFLPPDIKEHSSKLQYFLNEVRLSRQITHPNVCRVYDVAENDGQHFLSMEFIDGEDLRSLLRRIGRIPGDKGIQIAQQLCAGLAAAHDKGVLHRDLKPANIMLDGQGRAQITDFGIARLADGNDSGRIVGTPAYMAPEQLARGETSIQTDIYSLGLVLFEMFTGQSLYKATSISERLEADRHPRETLAATAPDLPAAVERAVLQCLEKNPQQRPRSARALAAALPGGDPLAAALAAGETPSPETVAAAGGEGVLKSGVGLACLGGVVAGLILACWLAQSTYWINRAGIDKHPQAMVADARRILEKLGYTDKPADCAFSYGFGGAFDSGWHFWFRQSPSCLSVSDFYDPFNKIQVTFNQVSYGAVTESIPRYEVPGEAGVALSPSGRLLWLRVVPSRLLPASSPEPRQPEWAKWFPEELIGFDLARLEKATNAVWRPPDAYEQLQVWRRMGPNSNVFYVEAAAFAGRPVYFHVLDPSWFESPAPTRMLSQQVIFRWMYLALVSIGAVLAWRNYRLRRSDRRGAFRLACYCFVLGLLISAIQAHRSLSEGETAWFGMGLGQAATAAIVYWMWYTALEPYVRRLWPEVLISWSRLLEGRWRDPLVGRSLIIGCLFGVAFNLVQQAHLLAPRWLGGAMHQLQISYPWALSTPGSLVANCLLYQISALNNAMFALLSLVLLQLLFRKRWLGAIGFVVIFTGANLWSGVANPVVDWLAAALLTGLGLWLLVQWGFLATVVAILCADLVMTLPLTSDLSIWYASHGLIGAGIVAAIALFGFYTSRPARRVVFESFSANR